MRTCQGHDLISSKLQMHNILKAHVESEQSFHFEAMISSKYTVNMKNDRYSLQILPEVEEKHSSYF